MRLAKRWSSHFQSRSRAPLLPPASAVINSERPRRYAGGAITRHQDRTNTRAAAVTDCGTIRVLTIKRNRRKLVGGIDMSNGFCDPVSLSGPVTVDGSNDAFLNQIWNFLGQPPRHATREIAGDNLVTLLTTAALRTVNIVEHDPSHPHARCVALNQLLPPRTARHVASGVT